MKERESGIDLLRCMGLLFVVSVHFFLYNGFYYEPQIGFWMWAADSFRWLFFGCNGLYMMLTGYLKSEKPLNCRYYRSMLPVIVGYVFTSAISIPIRHFFMDDQQAFAEWLNRFLNYSGCYYGWYVEMYIGLLLFSPIINLALEQMKEKKGLLWLAGTMVVLTALPSLTDLPLVPDYWVSLYPLTYYVIGAVIRRLQPRIPSWLGISVALLTAMGLGFVTLISTDKKYSEAYTQGYGGFWITVIVTCIFLSLYRVQLGKRLAKILGWAADGCFEGYLLSHLLDGWVYLKIPAWRTPEKYLTAYLCLTIPIFLASLLMGRLLHNIVAVCTSGKRYQYGKFQRRQVKSLEQEDK